MSTVVPTPRWRPLPGRGPEPSRLGEVLDRTLRSFGTPTSVSGIEVVFERWSDVVGEAMAARTRPVHIDGDTLVIGCDEPAVATHVRFLQAELVERLAELSGDRRLGRIEVRVDRVRRGPRPPRRGRSGAR
ncbi:MAG: DciA family protein [Acidimicrobiales bacterium]